MSAGIMDFERALRNILSNQAEDRKNGEIFIENLEKTQDFYMFLLTGLTFSHHLSCLSAILFRRKIIETRVFLNLDKNQQVQAKNLLLASVTPQQEASFLKIIASIIVPLFKLEENFEEAYSFLIFTKENLNNSFFMYLIENFITLWPAFVEGSRKQLCSLLWENTQDLTTQVLACQFLCLVSFEEQLISPAFSEKLLEVLRNNVENRELSDLLHEIFSLIEKKSRILQDRIEEFLSLLVLISRNQKCEDNKVSAVLMICEVVHSGISLKTIQDLLVFAFQLLSDVEYFSDVEAWGRDVKDFNVVNNDNLFLGKDLLLSLLLNDHCCKSYLTLAEAHIRSGHWVHQQAGILSLGFYCLEVKKYEHFYLMVLPFVKSNNPRLKWAACLSLNCFLHICPGEFSFNFDIWKELQLGIASNFENLAIASIQTSICLLEALKRGPNLDSGDFSSYMITIFDLFQSPSLKTSVLLELLELIIFIDQVKPEVFKLYSSQIINGLDSIIKSDFPLKIREKSIKTFSYFCLEKIEMAEYFCSLLFPLFGQNDEIDNVIIESSPLLMKTLQERFYPYSDFLMKIIIKNASIGLNFFDPSGKIVIEFLKDGSSAQLGLNTIDLNKKIIACKALNEMAALGKVFSPYVEETLRVVGGLTDFNRCKKISRYAKKTILSIQRIRQLQETERRELMAY
jgi:hypothetical protein